MNHSLNNLEKRNTGYKLIFIGSIDPRIATQEIQIYFQKLGLPIEIKNETAIRRKNYLIGKTTNMSTFDFLTKKLTKHRIKEFVLTTAEFLTGAERLKRDKEEAERKLFIGNLRSNTRNSELRDFFSHYGNVKTAYVKDPPRKGKSLKFGFVTFEKKESVENILAIRNFYFKGRKIIIKRFISKRIEMGNNPKNNLFKKKNFDENWGKNENLLVDKINIEKKKFNDNLSFTGYNDLDFIRERDNIFNYHPQRPNKRSFENFESESYNQKRLLELIDFDHMKNYQEVLRFNPQRVCITNEPNWSFNPGNRFIHH